MPAGIGDLQEFESRPHVTQLHREILGLHLNFEDFPQIGDGLPTAECQESDFLAGIIGRSKEGKALDVVPMKVGKRDEDLVLFVADGPEVLTQISHSGTGINDGNSVRIRERDLHARGIAAKLLETSIANRDGPPGTVKLKLHGNRFAYSPG